jgi:hypothetical protein
MNGKLPLPSKAGLKSLEKLPAFDISFRDQPSSEQNAYLLTDYRLQADMALEIRVIPSNLDCGISQAF